MPKTFLLTLIGSLKSEKDLLVPVNERNNKTISRNVVAMVLSEN